MTDRGRPANDRMGKRARESLEDDADRDTAVPAKKAIASSSPAATASGPAFTLTNTSSNFSPAAAGLPVISMSALTSQANHAGAPVADDIVWLTIAPGVPLIHGFFGPPTFSSKLACFDIDDTLISSISGAIPPRNRHDWKFWCIEGSVQTRLREYHAKGFAIILVSNQGYGSNSTEVREFRCKMALVGRALANVPFRLLAATSSGRMEDVHRKPRIGMWTADEQAFAKEGHALDKKASFYVGDAAGRPGDFAATDKEWARNIGILFYTPEQFFWEREDEHWPRCDRLPPASPHVQPV